MAAQAQHCKERAAVGYSLLSKQSVDAVSLVGTPPGSCMLSLNQQREGNSLNTHVVAAFLNMLTTF